MQMSKLFALKSLRFFENNRTHEQKGRGVEAERTKGKDSIFSGRFFIRQPSVI